MENMESWQQLYRIKTLTEFFLAYTEGYDYNYSRGLKNLEKIIYLLKYLGLIDYSFYFYWFGPISSQLETDLQELADFECVDIEYESHYNSFEDDYYTEMIIQPHIDKLKTYLKEIKTLMDQIQSPDFSLDNVTLEFDQIIRLLKYNLNSPRRLELAVSILYLLNEEKTFLKYEILTELQMRKPYRNYTKQEFDTLWEDLEAGEYVKLISNEIKQLNRDNNPTKNIAYYT